MNRRSSFRLALTLAIVAAALAVPLAAFAGGVTVKLDGAPPDPTAGQDFTVGFTVRSAHDGSLQSGLSPTVTATNAATGENVKVDAKPEGGEGHYVATMSLPSAGTWQWQIQPFGPYADHPATRLASLEVRGAGVAGSSAPVAPAAPAAVPWPSVAALLAAVALVALVALRLRRVTVQA